MVTTSRKTPIAPHAACTGGPAITRPPPRGAANPPPARDRPPRVALQPRLRPQHGEREERDDQHRGRGPREQPLRDRQLLTLNRPRRDGRLLPRDEPVRVRGGRQRNEGGQRRRQRPPGSPHSPDFTAFSNSRTPIHPPRRPVVVPCLLTTNSHGSLCRWNCCNGGRRPCCGS